MFYITSNDRGITPRCGDPGVFIPCMVKDFPHLKNTRFFLLNKKGRFITLFAHRQIQLHYNLRAPERKEKFVVLFSCHFKL
jgi:hypothetical protein